MMGERVKIIDYSDLNCSVAGVEDRVSEWEVGLPTADDLTPLSQSLIPPELASAFRICPEPSRSMLDVNCASQNTLSSLLAAGKGGGGSQGSNKFKLFHDETSGTTTTGTLDGVIMDIDDADLIREGSDSRKIRRVTTIGGGSAEEADSETNNNNNDYNNNNGNDNGGDDSSTKTLKRPRLVWTPQLHKRFVDVVAHLGIKNAVPKTIMQLMNVEGLTRENVASHLQKYRLYVKRMQGLSTEGPSSSSDHLFDSTPVPHSLQESGSGNGNNGNENEIEKGNRNGMSNGYMGMPFPMPYPPPPPPSAAQMVPVPMIQMPGHTAGGYYDSHHQYGIVQQQHQHQQQMDWPGNHFGSVVPHHYYHVAPNDK